MRYEIVTVGSSWGGLGALRTLLADLPADFPLPIAIAQHRSAGSRDQGLAAYYDARIPLRVCTIEDKEPIEGGRVYFAPPDYHLMVERGFFELSVDDRVQFSRPSADVLFESAVDAYGSGVIGVVLTGANADGAEGLACIKQHGGFTIVQDPETAEKREMPAAAIEAVGQPDAVLPLEEVASYLTKLAGESS